MPGSGEGLITDSQNNAIILGGPLTCVTPEGKIKWTYRNQWPGLHAGHATTARGDEPGVLIAPTRAAVREKLRAMLALTRAGGEVPHDADFRAFVSGESDEYPRYLTDTGLVGTPDEIKSQLQNYIAIGVSHFMLWYMDAPDIDGMQLFMEQVAPAFKSSQH